MSTTIGIAFALTVMLIITTLLLRRQIREKYAILWLVIGLAMLVLSVFPSLLIWLADVLGVVVPSNLLFAVALVLLIGVALHLSWELSVAEDEVRRVAEETAILRSQLELLTREVRSRSSTLDAAAQEETVWDRSTTGDQPRRDETACGDDGVGEQ